MTTEVVTLGEAMLRYWVPAGERIETAPSLRVDVGGSEANTAVALARMGRSVAWISRLPDNPLGRRTARTLAGHGVDVSHVVWSSDDRMGTYYVELAVPPRPASVVYDRAGSAASRLAPADIDPAVMAKASVAFVSGITAALSPSARDTAFAFLETAASAGATGIVDINYRHRLWARSDAAPILRDLAALAGVVIVSEEDARDLFGAAGDPDTVLRAMSAATGVGRVVLTRGAGGASWLDGEDTAHVGGEPAEVIDPIGAGDAFTAGVIIGLLDDDLARGVTLGATMGAIAVGLHGDLFTVDPDEVEQVLSGRGRDVAR